MATTTMHFGPEWMRAKPQTPARHQPPPSPPPPSTTQQPGVSTYSALVTPAAPEPEKRDESRPFRYTKEEMLRIYREGGGRAGLGLEVERWEGIVRDVGSDPAGLREMGEAEKKLFAGPLNSELRRRQSTDLINTLSLPSDRSRLNHTSTSGASPMRERFGSLMGRKRESTDQPPLALPRRLSLSGSQGGPMASPRDSVLPSPRNNRMGTFGSGFDGVLNSGDTWTRRRPSAGVTGAGGSTSTRVENREGEYREADIKEEEEELGRRANSTGSAQPSSPAPDVPPPEPSANGQLNTSEDDKVIQDVATMNLEGQKLDPNPPSSHVINPAISAPPPGLVDPTNVEWSYLDPQGQVQGPFRANLMQKWFDDGYFTPDLLMKRANIDVDWVAVGEFERRAGGGKIFLSQLPMSAGPPGLGIRTDSPQNYSPIHEQTAFNGYQPVPTRNLRAATLDSYLNNASPSGSSTESFGAGRFGNGSPDPSAFGGSVGNNLYSADPNFGTRSFGGARAPFQDDNQSLNGIAPARAPSIDTFNDYHGGRSPWPTAQGQMNQGFSGNEQYPFSNGFNGTGSGMLGATVSINQVHGFNQETFGDPTYSGMGSLADHHDSPLSRPPPPADTNGIPFGSNMLNGPNGSHFGGPSLASYPQTSTLPYTPSRQHQPVSPFGEVLQHATDSPSLTHTPASLQVPSASPWTTDPSAIRRTMSRTFDAPADTSPVVPPAQQASNWVTPQPAAPINDPSPWLMASIGTVDDVWKEIPGPNSLTFSNVGRHNRLQEEEGAHVNVSPIEEGSPSILATQQVPVDTVPPASTVPVPPTPSNSEAVAPATLKPRRKSTAREVQASATVPKPAPPPPPVKSPSPTPAAIIIPPKAAWITDDEKKLKSSGATTSLREIQEAEAKKAEARKGAEKERERVARPNAIAEELQPFTASWGLPTSQAGIRTAVPSKEGSTTSPTPAATPSAPVWTNPLVAPATKKTMKEIQEEEERKKKLAVKESVASAAARRAYAETTVKVTPSAQATSGGAWTTVGANGKPNVPPAAVPRPAAVPSTPTATPPGGGPRTNGGVTRPTAPPITKVASGSRVEDFPVTPSHEFLKWLTESLKGLNSSVNLEEITSMLLSFPLDPDPSTVEIISDLIYANSTTLNGRRFASEYVSKRKADAAARRGTTGTSGTVGKPISIADVVKTQPKAVQQEWGFKVVNKKKKGGRT